MFEFAVVPPNWATLNDLMAALEDMDAAPLMERWRDVIAEGNRRGVLQGVDGNDQPMPSLKYRRGKGQRRANRKAGDAGTNTYEPPGAGQYGLGLNDNLWPSQYRNLTGPRLAPRGEASRAIKNLYTRYEHDAAEGTWTAVGAWHDVLTPDGRKILPWHFEGLGNNPRYDLRPVRERDREYAMNALRAFVRQLFLRRY